MDLISFWYNIIVRFFDYGDLLLIVYFNDYRSNDCSFRQSVPAAFASSYIWQTQMKNEAPNDYKNEFYVVMALPAFLKAVPLIVSFIKFKSDHGHYDFLQLYAALLV